MKAYVVVAAAVVLGGVFYLLSGRENSSWIQTEAGAIRGDAYDYFQGHIDIHTAYKQDGVCKNYVNDLSSSSSSGIGGAVEDAAYYGTLGYYYYKTEAYLAFHKDMAGTFQLELFKSPTYFRLPRVVPDKQVILDKLQSLSLASQIEMTKALLNENGNARQFTSKDLADLIERIAGKQQFDLNEWVLTNFFDQAAQQFMNCVPDVQKLVEISYGPTQQSEMLRQLTEAENSMKSTGRKLSHAGLLD